MTVRLQVGLLVAAVIGVTMVQQGMEPRPVLVALVMVAVAATGALAYDLAELAAPLTWHNHQGRLDMPTRGDRRTQLLRLRLRHRSLPRPTQRSADDDPPTDEVGQALVAVIDEHLRTALGIDRSVDPEPATAALPDELARFVADPATCRAMTGRRRLPETIGAIEDLVGLGDRPPKGSAP